MMLEVKARPWSHGLGAFHRSLDVRRRLTPLDNVEFPKFRFVAMSVKRSPKRLKYSAPRFSKVSFLPFYSITPPPSPHPEMLSLIFLYFFDFNIR